MQDQDQAGMEELEVKNYSYKKHITLPLPLPKCINV